MKIPTLLCIFLVILFDVNSKSLDPGPKAINDSSPESASVTSESKISSVPSQKNKKRYATREVILYLTPSQIKALQEGKGLVSPQRLPESVDQEPPTDQDLKLQEQTEFVKQEFENIKSASIQQTEQPNEENLEVASQDSLLQKELIIENQQDFHNQWRQGQANREEHLKLLNYYQELIKAEQLKLQQDLKYNDERNAWLLYNPNVQISEGYRVQESAQDDQIEDKNQFQLRDLPSLPLYDQHSESILSQTEKPLLQLQYSPKYNDQAKAIEIEKILRTHHRHELEKQSALSEAEKIANSPAVLVHEEVKITKQRPVPVIKHVEVPVPAPVLISVPEPVPVKVPHPYPVFQKTIKHIAVPIVQKDKVEVEKPLSYDEEGLAPVPVTKTVFFNLDRPYFDRKILPVEIKTWS